MKLEIGMEAKTSRLYTKDDVLQYAAISLDNNPLHIDEDYARSTRFGRPIVHGMMVAAQISAIIANRLPGEGSVYLGQSLRFTQPVYYGDTIQCIVSISNIRFDKPICTLSTICINQHGLEVLSGEATVMYK